MEYNPYSAPDTNTNRPRTFDKRWWIVVPLICAVGIFATLPLLLALLCLLACNAIAYVVLLIARQTFAANLAFLTGILFLATLLLTDWGFSSRVPRIRVSWLWLVQACIAQIALIFSPIWLCRRSQNDH